MELLRFDSREPNAKYLDLIDVLGRKLTHVPLVTNGCAFEPAYAVRAHTHPPRYAA